jgi:thiol-disulfide isomerase/thioredoxin
LHDEEVSLNGLLAAGKPLLLIFSSVTCGACLDLLPEIVQWQRTHAAHLTLAVINHGEITAVRAKVGNDELKNILVQRENEVAAAYQVVGTPSALLIGVDGTIRSPLAAGVPAVRELVNRASRPMDLLRTHLLPSAPTQLDAPEPDRGLALGTPAPAFHLPNLAGEEVSVEQLRGAETVLLFWNPNCGFCRRMTDDLKAWEAQSTPDSPRLLVISTGSVEANSAQGLRSPVLLDKGFATGSAFGARGTPAAVRLDAEGKVASPVTVGAPAVLSLLRNTLPVQSALTEPVTA